MDEATVKLTDAPARLDGLTSRPWVRYSSVLLMTIAASAVAAVMPLAYRPAVLFLAILGSSLLGGLRGGLLATVLMLIASRLVFTKLLPSHEAWLLAGQGALLAMVGGMLLDARRKAQQQWAANLQLEQQILEISDDERRRIGHDLHDGLGQNLTGISLMSETIAQQVQGGTPPDPSNIETITRLASEAVALTRDLAKSLSPVTLERDGFIAGIQELATRSSSLFGVNCIWECDDEELPLDRTRSLHLYRIIQEAISNSVRHGKAHNIRITLQRIGDGMSVTVVDDGSGLSQKTINRPGLGLRIMQYRARMLNATLAVGRTSPKGGTVITVECPIMPAPRSVTDA